MYCEKCGNQVNDDHDFCTSCGFRLRAPAPAKPKSSLPTVALIFSFLLPITAIIISIIGLCKFRQDKQDKDSFVCSLIISINNVIYRVVAIIICYRILAVATSILAYLLFLLYSLGLGIGLGA